VSCSQEWYDNPSILPLSFIIGTHVGSCHCGFIVASGQTYERQSIQKWLDHGLNVCPKTHQRLTLTNVIPNYTVKSHVIRLIEDLHRYAYFKWSLCFLCEVMCVCIYRWNLEMSSMLEGSIQIMSKAETGTTMFLVWVS